MHISKEQLEALLSSKEDEHVEFKEAKNQFNFEELLEYCVALGNERGGRLVLGVKNRHPREVAGTSQQKNCRSVSEMRLSGTVRARR